MAGAVRRHRHQGPGFRTLRVPHRHRAGIRDVGTAYERALRAGTPIANTIGQHANDRMISFYSVSPDGWQVEIGATGRTVDENWKEVVEYDRISDWGHQPLQVLTEMLSSAKA